jgi:hypothetical protein
MAISIGQGAEEADGKELLKELDLRPVETHNPQPTNPQELGFNPSL